MNKKLPKKLVGEFLDAAVEDQEKASQLLKDYPDLLNARWISNETILHFLAVESYVDGVLYLARAGADVNLRNKFGNTPLIDVAMIGNNEVAEVLLAHGADPNVTSDISDNPLHCAVSNGNARLVGMLLDKGARHDYVTDIKETVTDALPNDDAARVAVVREFNTRKINLKS
ncbi:MAG TPA: hypothetical protein DCO77_09125 [Nitrospiraceae bacterium]|nr:hypothetical protein [Nitrospiraceae bacterium]